AHNNLGLCLTGLGRREQAVASYRRALELQPDYVEALNNLGTLLPELGGRREAIALLRRAIELDPARAESHRNLANVVFEFRRFEEAAASYRQALALQPQNALAHAGLGAALRMQGHTQAAEASCRAALAIDPKCVSALSLLGELRADRGQFVEAERLFREVIALDPGFPFAFYSIAMNRRMTRADGSWLQGAEALLATPLPLRHEISLRYALGKYCDDIQEYERAFGNFKAANELTKRYAVSYDRAQVSERVARVTRRFDAESMRRFLSRGDPSERPVFIVGMPRSGTSLTEQILASHPAVFGAGELAFWQTAFATYEAAELKGEDGTSLLPGMARDYLARLRSLSADAQRVVDKMPLNFLNAGQICAALPHARIIHVRRHPIDTCLSIYFHYFSHLHPYANDFENLAHYYREYVRITDHWRAVLPAATLLEVPYEGLIADQEGWTRRMLDFIGLPWDPQCLEFDRTERVVITLSKWQVRQKIHASSVARWRHYEPHVAPLLPLLELAAPAQALTRSELGS
ncbi:MAG TPA: sulfotransferase, partial [Steroidobacteraceae bacterium]|nr:sulfotransferase [Steroidobacteraceae bacterium]